MWWLKRPGRRDRGAVAVVVALCMVVLLGFSALAIDIGGIISDHQQLQNGADAAALAIAESCQRDMTTCTQANANATGDKYAKANKLAADSTLTTTVVLDATHGVVQVEVKSTHTNYFAGVLGKPTSDVSAHATAAFGYISGGTTLPLAFSICAFELATGGWDDQGLPKFPDTTVVVNLKDKTVCSTPAHNEVPGGFGWVDGQQGCKVTFRAGDILGSSTGYSEPAFCSNFDWKTIQNKTVLVPIFSKATGSGNNAEYTIQGLAAFRITGYCFSNSDVWNLDNCPSNKRIQGKFTRYTEGTGGYIIDPNAAHFGSIEVRLTA